jgi:hypothetical protein
MPSIPLPLRTGDAEIALDLQAAFDRASADGFSRSVDYSVPPGPPLPPADAAWAAELVAR